MAQDFWKAWLGHFGCISLLLQEAQELETFLFILLIYVHVTSTS